MIDLLHLPEPDERVVWFPGQGMPFAGSACHIWNKPNYARMVAFWLVSAGGGGGGGAGNISGSTAGGGAGGNAGQAVFALFMASMLPPRLYVTVSTGGTGGAGGGSGLSGDDGGEGNPSVIAIQKPLGFSSNNGDFLLTTSAQTNYTRGGGGGTTSFGGGITANQTPGQTDGPLGQMAVLFRSLQGERASNGQTGANIDVAPTFISSGKGGGGKTSGAGGVGAGYFAASGTALRTVPGGTANTGEDASSGFIHAGIHYGGCGGGGNNLGGGGRGGNGVAWGAGGGGGGGGLTGGRGGDGGPGLVIIASW